MQITLKAARVNAGLTQAQVAHALGIDKKTLINWEKYKTYPTSVQLKRMCDMYKMPIDYIFLSC